MNKYLMLSAAASVCHVGLAIAKSAGSGSVHLVAHSPGGASYCDTYTITWSGNNYADVVDWTPCFISSHSNGMGIERQESEEHHPLRQLRGR